MAPASDFVNVQLSAAGAAAAGAKGQLRLLASHIDYTFTPGAPVRVLVSDWTKVLSRETLKGNLIFELAPDGAAAAAASADESRLKTLQAEEAALEIAIAKEGN